MQYTPDNTPALAAAESIPDCESAIRFPSQVMQVALGLQGGKLQPMLQLHQAGHPNCLCNLRALKQHQLQMIVYSSSGELKHRISKSSHPALHLTSIIHWSIAVNTLCVAGMHRPGSSNSLQDGIKQQMIAPTIKGDENQL